MGTKEGQLLAKINEELYNALDNGFIIKVTLRTGNVIEGVMLKQRMQNTGPPNNPRTSFLSEIVLTELNGTQMSIDLLNVSDISSAISPETLRKYKEAGLIQIDENNVGN